MANFHVLFVTTSAAKMDNGDPTGIWLEELTTPYYAFTDAGASVVIASVAGGAVPVDPRSIAASGENAASVERALKDDVFQKAMGSTDPASAFGAKGFDAIFLPGGHGTMFDYPTDRSLAQLIEAFDRAKKIIAAVCHGPAGLLSALSSDGAPLVMGRRVAAFSDSEEHAVGLQDAVPFLLEKRLKDLGVHYQSAPDFESFAVRDGNLITGQNPASAAQTAALVLETLNSRDAA